MSQRFTSLHSLNLFSCNVSLKKKKITSQNGWDFSFKMMYPTYKKKWVLKTSHIVSSSYKISLKI